MAGEWGLIRMAPAGPGSVMSAEIQNTEQRFGVILVRPSYPSNMGAVARTVAAFGGMELLLVAPERDPLAERARENATFGVDLLARAPVCRDLAAAVSGFDVVIGTTNKPRSLDLPSFEAPDLPAFLAERDGNDERIAVVLGPERTGLTNEDLQHCHYLCTIPTASERRPLNLAQAAAIFAYELAASGRSEAAGRSLVPSSEKKASMKSVNHLAEQLHRSWDSRSGLLGRAPDRERILAACRRLNRIEVDTVIGMLRRLEAGVRQG